MGNAVEALENLLRHGPDIDEARCTKCPLWETSIVQYEDGSNTQVVRRSCVGPRGIPTSPIMLVGEAPGDYEIALDTPFVGPAGEFLNQRLDQYGLAKRVFVTNTIRCRVPFHKVPPRSLYAPCPDYLNAEIMRYRPTVIGTLGATATHEVLRIFGVRRRTITMQSVVGDVLQPDRRRCWTDRAGPYIVPIYHPSAYLRRDPEDPLEWLDPISFDNSLRTMAKLARIEVENPLPNYLVVKTFEQAVRLLNFLAKQPTISFDLETSPPNTALRRERPNVYTDKVLCFSFCWAVGKAATLPWRHQVENPGDPLLPVWTEEQSATLLGTLDRILGDSKIVKMGHNARLFDCRVLRYDLGIRVKNLLYDGMTLAHMIDQEGSVGLKELSFHYTKLGNYEDRLDAARAALPKNSSFALLDADDLYKYAAADADAEMRVVNRLLDRIRRFDQKCPCPHGVGVEGFYHKVMLPVMHLADHMMDGGIRVDTGRVHKLIDKYKEEISGLNQDLSAYEEVKRTVTLEEQRRDRRAEEKRKQQLAARPPAQRKSKPRKPRPPKPIQFNCRSSTQIQTLLFDVLRLPVIKLTDKGSRSTGKKVLAKYQHPLAKLLVEARQILSYSSYLKKSILGLLSEDGMLRTSYRVIGTETGRWTSSNPNLQNIVNRGPRAKEIKSIFCARPGYVLFKEDYAQAEFRLLAIYSNDEVMKEDIRTGFDVHRYVASVAFGKTEEEIQQDKEAGGDLREKAKTGVFETIYGGGPETLALQVGIPVEVAKKIQDAFWGRYRIAEHYMDEIRQFARKTGYVRSLHGRIRAIRGIKGRQVDFVTKLDREACNSPIQGACHDENTTRAINLRKAFRRYNIDGRVCLHIHDAIVSEVSLTDMSRAIRICRKVKGMAHKNFDIPMPVELHLGFNLGEMVEPEKFQELLEVAA